MRQYYWAQPSTHQTEPSLAEPPQLTEPELKTLRRQYELILNAVGEGVYGLDREGKVTFVNPAAAIRHPRSNVMTHNYHPITAVNT